jgi:hypothetical protein
MSALTFLPPAPPVPGPPVRVEYIGFRNAAEHREFRLRAHGSDGWTEFRFGIAFAAFGAGRVSLQDGPDVCYQKLVQAIAAGEAASPDVITIDDVELARYRESRKRVPKRRSWAPESAPAPPEPPPPPVRTPSPRRIAKEPVANGTAPGLEKGQRVSHAIFGVGVMTASSGAHTSVCFDEGGRKTFVTSMVELDVLSGPQTWETSPRGTNRPCRILAPAIGLPEGEAKDSA